MKIANIILLSLGFLLYKRVHADIPDWDLKDYASCLPNVEGEPYHQMPDQIIYIRENPHQFISSIQAQFRSISFSECEHVTGMLTEILGIAYFQLGKYDSSAWCLHITDSLVHSKQSPGNRIVALHYLGYIQSRIGDFKASHRYQLEGYQLATQSNDSSFLGHIEAGLAYALWHMGQEEEAFNHMDKAIQTLYEHGDSTDYYRCMQNQGVQLIQKGNFEEALPVFEKVSDHYERTDNQTYRSIPLSNQGLALVYLGRPAEANYLMLEAAAKMDAISFPVGKAYYLAVTAFSFQKLEKWETGKEYIEKAKVAIGNTPNVKISSFLNLLDANYYEYLGQPRLAVKSYKLAAPGAFPGHTFINLEEIYLSLYRIYSELDMKPEAEAALTRLMTIKDSLTQNYQGYAVELAKANQEVELKNQELQLMMRQQEIDRLTKTQLWLALGGVLLVIGLGVVFARYRFQLYKRNQLATQQAELLNYTTELEELAFTLSHNLREPIRHIGSFTGLLKHRIGPQVVAAHQEYFDYLTHASQRIHILLSDLNRFMETTANLEAPEQVQLSKTIMQIEHDLGDKLAELNGHISYPTHLPIIEGHPRLMYLLFFELIENGVKFHNGHPPKVHLTYSAESDGHHFTISDEGTGINPLYRDKVFRLFYRVDPSKYLEDTGIGLAVVAKIVRLYKGHISFAARQGGGTNAHLHLPYKLDK